MNIARGIMIKKSISECKKKLDFATDPELKAQKQIKQYKKAKRLVFNKNNFQALVQEISDAISGGEYKWSKSSSEALQQITEDYAIGILEDSNYCANHGNRITLLVKDIQLARRIRGRFETFIETAKIN